MHFLLFVLHLFSYWIARIPAIYYIKSDAQKCHFKVSWSGRIEEVNIKNLFNVWIMSFYFSLQLSTFFAFHHKSNQSYLPGLKEVIELAIIWLESVNIGLLIQVVSHLQVPSKETCFNNWKRWLYIGLLCLHWVKYW